MNQAEEQGREREVVPGNEPEESPQCSQRDESAPDEQKRAYSDLHDQFLRLAADFENFKKRTARDRETSIAMANERFAADVLEIVDNLERAQKADDAHLREGLEQIQLLLSSVLQRHGIEPVESLSKKFNPAEHEAVAQVPSDQEPGIVIDELSRGYRMHDKIIRFAKVAVSKAKEG